MSAALAVWSCAAAEPWSHAQRGHVTAAAHSLPAAWRSAKQAPNTDLVSQTQRQRHRTTYLPPCQAEDDGTTSRGLRKLCERCGACKHHQRAGSRCAWLRGMLLRAHDNNASRCARFKP